MPYFYVMQDGSQRSTSDPDLYTPGQDSPGDTVFSRATGAQGSLQYVPDAPPPASVAPVPPPPPVVYGLGETYIRQDGALFRAGEGDASFWSEGGAPTTDNQILGRNSGLVLFRLNSIYDFSTPSRDWAKYPAIVAQISGDPLYGFYPDSAKAIREYLYALYDAMGGASLAMIEPDYYAREALIKHAQQFASGYTEASSIERIRYPIMERFINQPALVTKRGGVVIDVFNDPKVREALAASDSAAWDRWRSTQRESSFMDDVAPFLMLGGFLIAAVAAPAMGLQNFLPSFPGSETILATPAEAVAIESSLADAFAVGWESAVTETSLQNVALAEVGGSVASGTLANAIGAEAAAAYLQAATEIAATSVATTAIQNPPASSTSPPPAKPATLSTPTIGAASSLLKPLLTAFGGSGSNPLARPQLPGVTSPQLSSQTGSSVRNFAILAGLIGTAAIIGVVAKRSQ